VNPTGTRVFTTTLGDGQNAFVVHTISSCQLSVDGSQPAVVNDQPNGAEPASSGLERPTGNWQLTTDNYFWQPYADNSPPTSFCHLAEQVFAALDQSEPLFLDRVFAQPGPLLGSEQNDMADTSTPEPNWAGLEAFFAEWL